VKRLGPFAAIFGFYAFLAWLICDQLEVELDLASLVVAGVVAALTGFTWFFVSDWWDTATRPGQPQRVYLETKETPSRIVSEALWALVRLFLLVVGMGIILGVVISRGLEGYP